MRVSVKNFFLILFLFVSLFPLSAKQLAFPGAEGFGKYAVGGRGCIVYHVTNLDDSGKGSFRDAVSQPHRTVVFDLSGVIRIKSKLVVSSNITIAGQTAPKGGIVVYGNGVSMTGANDVIIRYIKFRGSVNMGRGVCTLACDNAHNVIFDHVSVEWGRWDNLHIKESDSVTVQNSLIGEGVNPQMFGALLENPTHLTIYHCLWVDNQSRNPKAKASIEVVNSVMYNWGSNGLVGGHSEANHFQDIIGNYFVAGPNSTEHFVGMFTATDHVYQKGNMADLNKDGFLNGRTVVDSDFVKLTATLIKSPQNSAISTAQSAEDALKYVLKECGDVFHRDEIDNRLIGYVCSFGKSGQIIKDEAEVGGQKNIKSEKCLKDSDGDGIPDEWEQSHNLNKNDANDGQKINTSGYSNLELYLNSIVEKNSYE